MALHNDYRAPALDAFWGKSNEGLVQSLDSVLSRKNKKNIRQAYIIEGPSGCGKTTLARIIRDRLSCSDHDYYEYDSTNASGIDFIRKLHEKVPGHPMEGDVKMYVFDEVHRLSPAAKDGLLKMLEEPPVPFVYFCLCTTESLKLTTTLKRRCHISKVNPLFPGEIKQYLEGILKAEELDPAGYKETVKKITQVCQGSPGIALSFLDQVIDMESEELAVQAIESITVKEHTIVEICRIFVDSKISKKWETIKPLLNTLQGDPESCRYGVLNYMNTVLLGDGIYSLASVIMLYFLESFQYSGQAGFNYAVHEACVAVENYVPF